MGCGDWGLGTRLRKSPIGCAAALGRDYSLCCLTGDFRSLKRQLYVPRLMYQPASSVPTSSNPVAISAPM